MPERRKIVDAEKEVSVSLPAAAANANSGSIDLGKDVSQELDNFLVEVAVDATTALVDGKDIDIHLEDSADNSSFSDLAYYKTAAFKVTGKTGNGSDEKKFQIRLDPGTRR